MKIKVFLATSPKSAHPLRRKVQHSEKLRVARLANSGSLKTSDSGPFEQMKAICKLSYYHWQADFTLAISAFT
jgi:hypothetical protein